MPRPFSDMNTVDLLSGEQRCTARSDLEKFIDGNISYEYQQRDPRHWYWQSLQHPKMVILEKWFV